MRIYEELFILDPKATDEQIDAALGVIEEVVQNAGGSVDKVEKWGVRKLAYHVRKREEGYYVLVQFSAGASAVREIERRFRVDENVIKFMSVRIDEKLKWLEKRRKIREKRAAKRPPAPPRRGPERRLSEKSSPVPGAPATPAAAAAESGNESKSNKESDDSKS